MRWRKLFGNDPNTITSMMEKVSWAFVFICSWCMLWKLDSLLGHEPAAPKTEIGQETKKDETSEDEASGTEEQKKEKGQKEPDRTEKAEKSETAESSETFASVQPESPFDPMETGFAKTLGLEKPYSEKEIKSAYRKLIAQYHPDRVSAMGPEIREVAETKAREINEAYEYFRKKFDQDQ